MNNPYAKYKEQSVTTATPEELTLMLYNGCIKFINLAEVYIEEKDYVKKQFIKNELMNKILIYLGR